MTNHPNRRRFHDFTGWTNFGNDPRRAEQLLIASTLDLSAINVVRGPIGSHGFRRGTWTVQHDGQEYSFFASIPHGVELGTQMRMVREDAALHIAGLRSGYIASGTASGGTAS